MDIHKGLSYCHKINAYDNFVKPKSLKLSKDADLVLRLDDDNEIQDFEVLYLF